jgi:glycosyltransferase involved in cell wall biosynthesis
VEEYCDYLTEGLAAEGISLEKARIPWAEMGWRKALSKFRDFTLKTDSVDWFLLQYTALSWSRHGFSIGALRLILLLKRKGAQCAVVFHDAEAYRGKRFVDLLRRTLQIQIMRQALRFADLGIFTIPPQIVPWASPNARNAVFIPVGANLPAPERAWKEKVIGEGKPPTVVIFSLSEDEVRKGEVAIIAEAARYTAERLGKLRVVVLGRNSEAGGRELEARLAGTPVEIVAHGLVESEQAVEIIGNSDAMLFVRGPLSTRRGSAIAGIACGLPVVAREGWETASPITDAGVVLVLEGAKEGFGPALHRVLSDPDYRASLAERSKDAQERHFSWSAIAEKYATALRGGT